MTRLIIIGMAIAVSALTGCVDDRDIRSLRNAQISLSNEVNYLQVRIAAVEKACLQLNTLLMETEGRKRPSDQPAISKPVASRAQKTEQLALASESNAKLTRSSFSGRLVGMTVSEVLTMLGNPDKTSENAGILSWNYTAIRLTTESGGLEVSPALIVFEQGCVSRAVLTENVQYSSEPKESESSNAAVQTNQTGPTNETMQTNEAVPTNQ